MARDKVVRFMVQVRFWDEADDTPQSAWDTLPVGYFTYSAAYRRAVRIESQNMASGADCTARVVCRRCTKPVTKYAHVRGSGDCTCGTGSK